MANETDKELRERTARKTYAGMRDRACSCTRLREVESALKEALDMVDQYAENDTVGLYDLGGPSSLPKRSIELRKLIP